MNIELIKNHTHAGNRLAAGARIDVSDTSARWLITHGVAKPADGKPRRDTTPAAPSPITAQPTKGD
jgi:hypothetical protein